jgi:hypothetical protein
VKDVALELQIFPEFDGDTVRFTTAKPGETGASKVSLQLGSIRDSQIKEIAKKPLTKDDVSIEDINLPEPEKKQLRKLGIHSAEDLRRTTEERNVDIGKVTNEKVDYKQLANVINQARRKQQAPSVSKASVSQAQGKTIVTLQGENLAIASSLDQFPLAMLNDKNIEVVSANEREVQLQVNEEQLQRGQLSQLKIALDPYAIVTMNLKL